MKSPCYKCPKSGTVHTRCDEYNTTYRNEIDHINHVRAMERVFYQYAYPKIIDNAVTKAR